MYQGPESSYEFGLEIDRRQDDAPTRYLGRQDEFPTVHNNSGQNSNHLDLAVNSQAGHDLPSHMPITETRSRVCGLRVSTLWLVATVIVLLVLAGVGMGVLGSRITRKKNDIVEQNRCVLWSGVHELGPYMYCCIRVSRISRLFIIALLLMMNALSNSSRFTQSESAFISSTASLAISSTSSSAISSITPFPVVEPLPHPNNDCEAVQPLYIIKNAKGKLINATFDIHCDTQFAGGDFLSFYSPSVTTCIRACAVFNVLQTQTENGESGDKLCSAIVYWPNITQDGNCYLKPAGYTSVVSRSINSTYAKLRMNN